MRRLSRKVTQHSFRIALTLIVAGSAGCAGSRGFDQAAMREALHLDTLSTPENRPLSHQSALPASPFRLGVFFVKHDVPDTPSIRKVEWLSADRDQLFRELAPLRDEQLLTDTFVLVDVTLRGEDINGIRQAGARFGADMVLIIDGVAAVDRYNNRLAWLYPTVIGAYLAPGTESDTLAIATGSLWAVRSDWHAPILTVEARSKTVGAAAFVEDATALQEAKQQAIQALGKRITDQLQSLNKPKP
ncbi:MAG: hypothetical protein JSS38_04370 [Nitrospira sp.]|nr:hypothetical protein [Nitrospira sp.]